MRKFLGGFTTVIGTLMALTAVAFGWSYVVFGTVPDGDRQLAAFIIGMAGCIFAFIGLVIMGEIKA